MNELQDSRSDIVKILGGGQLALLSAIVALQMGYNVEIASENPSCPAVIGSNFYLSNNSLLKGGLTISHKLLELKNEIQVNGYLRQNPNTILDTEHISSKAVWKITRYPRHPFYERARVLCVSQDKYSQRLELANALGTGMAKYMLINTESKDIEIIKQEIQKAFSKLGTKIVIKRAKDAYDGNGNFVLEENNLNNSTLPDWILDGSKIFAEEFLDIQAEFALQIIKKIDGSLILFNPVKLIQENGITKKVIHDIIPNYNANVNLEEIYELGNTVLEQFSASGIYSLEIALCKNADGSEEFKLIEFAYRVHNSGHGLIKNQPIYDNTQIRDQFQAEIAVRMGLENIRLSNQSPTLMFNLIGSQYTKLMCTKLETIINETLNEYQIQANVTVFWYFKDEAKDGRKMGHLNIGLSTLSDLNIVNNIISSLLKRLEANP